MFGMPDAMVIIGVLGTVAVGILKLAPARGNGKYVSQEVFQVWQQSMGNALKRIEERLASIEKKLYGN